MNYKDKGYILDSILIEDTLKEMDKDVATRFVASAFSLSPKKLHIAFEIACHEMDIRNKAKAAKRRAQLDQLRKTTSVKNKSSKDVKESISAADDIIESISLLFKKTDPDPTEE